MSILVAVDAGNGLTRGVSKRSSSSAYNLFESGRRWPLSLMIVVDPSFVFVESAR